MSTYIVVEGEEQEGGDIVGAYFNKEKALKVYYSLETPCSCDFVELWKVTKNKSHKRKLIQRPGLILLKKRTGV
jgi:hypothetical protein